MEKLCEFCMAFRPTVYCKADAALLCLSCDAKVHSANALSFRHPRTFVCDLCRYSPAHVICLEHNIFICRSCDSSHSASCLHRRKAVGYYVGCPSAIDLASLWQLDLSEEDSASKAVEDESSEFILNQIAEMERLQLSDYAMEEHRNLCSDTEYFGGEALDSLSSPFLDNPFSKSRSPLQNNEIWMQDLGVCDETQCPDDVNIPDVDLTFRNFEDIFADNVCGTTTGTKGFVSLFTSSSSCRYKTVFPERRPNLFNQSMLIKLSLPTRLPCQRKPGMRSRGRAGYQGKGEGRGETQGEESREA